MSETLVEGAFVALLAPISNPPEINYILEMFALSGLVRKRGAFTNCVRAVVCAFTDAKPPTFEELLNDGSSQSLDRAAKMLVDL